MYHCGHKTELTTEYKEFRQPTHNHEGGVMKQKEAVLAAVMSVFAENQVEFIQKHSAAKSMLSDGMYSSVVDIVTEGIKSGHVSFSDAAHEKYHSDDLKRDYVKSMVNNWLKKDERLNGGVEYKPKNPGSRTGVTDPEIKNLKLLLKSGKLKTKEAEDKVKERIEAKKAELRASKENVEVDLSAIDPALLEELGVE